jgi:hypothetical protein
MTSPAYGSADWPRNSYQMDYSATPSGPAPAPEPTGGSYMYGGQPPQPPKRRKRLWITVGVAAVGLSLWAFAGIAASSGGDRAVTVATPTATSKAKGEPLGGAASASHSASKKVASKPRILEGVSHVGEDIPAGTYRTDEAVTQCYWEKSTDAEGQSIIDNDIVTGGRPQVILKKGQWFTSQDCGTWTKR